MGSGPQSGQLGFGDETTYGTAVTPDKFLPLLSEDTDKHYVPIIDESVFAGRRFRLGEQEVAGNLVAGGSFQTNVYGEGMRKLLTALFGVETWPGTGTPTRSSVYTPGDLSDDSLTVELNAPSSAGDQVKTLDGVMITGASFEYRQGQLIVVTWDIIAQDLVRGTSPTSATIAAMLPLKAVGNTMSLTGMTTPVPKSVRIRVDNGLVVDRRSITTDEILQPKESGVRKVTADIVYEFDQVDAITAHTAHTEVDLALTASDALPRSLGWAIHGFVQPGVGQKLNTRTGLLEQTVSIEAFADLGGGTDADAVTCTYETSEDV